MSTATATKLTRQDYDDLHDAFAAPGDYRAMVSRMFEAVEQIVARHCEAGE
jgi:hypothetical protein